MDQHRDSRKTPDRIGQPEAEKKSVSKKVYVSPVLVEYGTIAKLTQGSKTRNTDGANTRRNTCL